jgi:hypothetical protein
MSGATAMFKLSSVLTVACLLCPALPLAAQSAVVPKTNPMPVYMHYMPWFQTPQTLGPNNWGWHWTMNNRNPNVIDSSGQRQIASHYYPLIGPYDSSDKYVIEYHMLLAKLCGVDGVIVDWYGNHGTNGDINSLLSASNKIVAATKNYGLQVGVTLEDRFAASTADVTANINYLQQNYFTQPNYIRVGASKSALMTVFGPVKFQQPSQWNTILSGPGEKPAVVPIQYQSQQVGTGASGEFAWVYQDAGTQDHLTVQKNFLSVQAPKFATSLGVAYAGYHDYYAQGNAGAGAGFIIPSNNGQTLTDTLALDQTYSKNISAIQLATWNDFGEGTQLEPTVQDGFTNLQKIQTLTGVSYGLSELQLVYHLYQARQSVMGNANGEALLDQAAADINQLDFTGAQAKIDQAVPEPAMLPVLVAMAALMGRWRARGPIQFAK